MSLMSKNKPTKRVPFDGGFVELQFLSKGVKDEYQRRVTALIKDLGNIDAEELKKFKEQKESEEIPKDIDFESLLGKINEAEYYKVAKAIKSWSEPEEISEVSVQDLDDEIFSKISKEIDNMNGLSKGEEKN